MRERLSDYQELYGDLYNLEATPAESTAYRLAKHDKARYPDIITAHEGRDALLHQLLSHLPVGYTEDVFAALDVQDELQTLYTSRHGVPHLPGRKAAQTGSLPPRWCARSRRTMSCPITRCRRPIPSARSTAT